MCWLAALGPEVVRVGGQWFAEVLLPNTVDDGTSRQRIPRIRNPPRQCQTPAIKRILDLVRIARLGTRHRHAQAAEHTGRHCRARSFQ